jgi:hypothetical protein
LFRSNASGQNGFEVVLNFIFSVLQPGRYESEALFAGDVIVIMMIQVSYPFIPQTITNFHD